MKINQNKFKNWSFRCFITPHHHTHIHSQTHTDRLGKRWVFFLVKISGKLPPPFPHTFFLKRCYVLQLWNGQLFTMSNKHWRLGFFYAEDLLNFDRHRNDIHDNLIITYVHHDLWLLYWNIEARCLWQFQLNNWWE